jgi:hypothetical protein
MNDGGGLWWWSSGEYQVVVSEVGWGVVNGCGDARWWTVVTVVEVAVKGEWW